MCKTVCGHSISSSAAVHQQDVTLLVWLGLVMPVMLVKPGFHLAPADLPCTRQTIQSKILAQLVPPTCTNGHKCHRCNFRLEKLSQVCCQPYSSHVIPTEMRSQVDASPKVVTWSRDLVCPKRLCRALDCEGMSVSV